MTSTIRVREWIAILVMAQSALFFGTASAAAQSTQLERSSNGIVCTQGADKIEITAFATNILRVDVRPGGVQDERTPVLDPAAHATNAQGLKIAVASQGGQITTKGLQASFDCATQSLSVSDGSGHVLLEDSNLVRDAAQQMVSFHRPTDEPIYGMTGIDRNKAASSLERPRGAAVKAGAQGNGGAPFFFTKSFGVLIDSVDGAFEVHGADIAFKHSSRKELEFYVLAGAPLSTISSIADLTGHAPMPPRWTLGFLNSQWGIDEAELKTLVAHYRASHIPLDAFIIDYDWKAWGEDDYGEWRWNSTSGPGNQHPDKFPDGANGALGREMQAQGVHLAGILKPRILLYKEGTTEFLQAAAYADAHHFWYPGLGSMMDYTTKRPTANIDFSQPDARTWFWKHLEPAFDGGMVAWWNDEADEVGLADKTSVPLNSMEFFNMGRALYDGQRSYSNTRVWSLNRNFYLGAQRYGYAEWSGDISTGAVSMAQQPIRMLATLNMGEPHWSMDTGGFRGNPTSEEYARWIEFAAFTPIFRVHASHNQKRQPWVFGPVAEAAATQAMRLRYSLLPTIYSAERTCYETGIGIVRPLAWIFPDDPTAAQQTDEWMFGDALLAAPVLDLKAQMRKIYLPEGRWTEYTSGKVFAGGQTIEVATDSKTWSDIPLFVRDGEIVATEEPGDDTDAMHPTEITLDIFPSQNTVASWTMYDDDGTTYSYESKAYFKQKISAAFTKDALGIDLSPSQGSFTTSVKSYRIRIHSVEATSLRWQGKSLAKSVTLDGSTDNQPSWTATRDRFGDGIEVRVKAGVPSHLDLIVTSPHQGIH